MARPSSYFCLACDFFSLLFVHNFYYFLTQYKWIIFADADFCCNLRSPSDIASKTSNIHGSHPGRSHSRGPLILRIQFVTIYTFPYSLILFDCSSFSGSDFFHILFAKGFFSIYFPFTVPTCSLRLSKVVSQSESDKR